MADQNLVCRPINASWGGGGANALAVAHDGGVVVTGEFWGDTPFAEGIVLSASGGATDGDIFVAKYDAAGTLMWATRPRPSRPS